MNPKCKDRGKELTFGLDVGKGICGSCWIKSK